MFHNLFKVFEIHIFYFSVKILHNVCWFLGTVRIKQMYPDNKEVLYATFAVAKRKPEKSCIYNCDDHPSFNSSPAVHIYDFHIFITSEGSFTYNVHLQRGVVSLSYIISNKPASVKT